jgi:hypothetical protein
MENHIEIIKGILSPKRPIFWLIIIISLTLFFQIVRDSSLLLELLKSSG